MSRLTQLASIRRRFQRPADHDAKPGGVMKEALRPAPRAAMERRSPPPSERRAA